jgi:capsule assembly protein Wzi
MLIPSLTSADPWLAPGDVVTRHDIEMLADAGVIKGPITQWPIPWPDIARDVNGFDQFGELTAAEQGALSRLKRTARVMMRTNELQAHARVAGTNEPDELRGFAATPREDGEIEGGIAWTGKYLAFRAQATAVADADDDKTWRPDGSYIGATIGNVMLSGGYMDRWWGPGWDGSLILSSSARPIPTLTVERNYSDPFSVPVLKWLGPWRASIGFGALESHREDFDDTRIFEARVTFKPWKHLEIGLSRTALLCGEGRPCDLGTFWDMFTGNDNDQDPSQQPGDQLAGYDLRFSSPWRRVPFALYGQMIGEDEAGALPSKFLGLFGIEHWGTVGSGSYRVHFEYSDTACDFSRQVPQFDCAYESSIYTVGYRFRGRSIGQSIDSDSRLTTVGVLYVSPGSASWELVARDAKLNRDATTAPETAQTLAPLATDVESIDLFYRRDLLGGRLVAGAGFESREVSSLSSKDDEWRVMGQWVREF